MRSAGRRRLGRAIGWGLGLLVGVPIGLVLLALLALSLSFTRAPLVQWGLGFANDALDGMRIELDRAERLDPWGIDLADARLFDAQGRLMVSVKKASFRLAPWALVRSTLHVESARIDGVRVRLYASEPTPEPPEEQEAAGEPSTFQVVVERLRLGDASLRTEQEGRKLYAELPVLEAKAAYGPRTAVGLRTLVLRADVDGQPALRLTSREGRWNEQKGGHVAIGGKLLGARFELVLDVPTFTEDKPWPIQKVALDLEGLTADGLARVGLAESVGLQVPASLHLKAHVEGPRDEKLMAQLEVRAGPLRLDLAAAATKARSEVHVELFPVELSTVSTVAPSLRVGGVLDLALAPTLDPREVSLAWHKLALSGRAVPPGKLQIARLGTRVELRRLTFSGLEKALSLQGAYDTRRGEGDLSLSTRDFELSRLGGLAPDGLGGQLNGTLRAHLAKRTLSGQSDLTLRDFRLGATSLGEASLELALSGRVNAPRGRVRLTAHDLLLEGEPLSLVSLEAEAGARDLHGKLSVQGEGRALDLNIDGTRARGGKITLRADGTGRLRDEPLGLSLEELSYDHGTLVVDALHAFSGREKLALNAQLTRRERIAAEVVVEKLDLRRWTRLLLPHPIEGVLDLRAKAEGALNLPSLWVELSLRGAKATQVPRAPKVDADARLVVDLREHHAELTFDAESEDKRVDVALQAKAEFPKPGRALLRAVSRARLELDLKSHADLTFVAQFAGPPLNELAGALDARIQGSGTFADATLDAHLGARMRPATEPGGAPDALALDAKLDREAFDADFAVRDRKGRLLDLVAHVALPEGGPRALLEEPEALWHAPAKLELSLLKRRLDRIEGALGLLVRAYGASLPVQVAADLAAESDGHAITGQLSAKSHVWGEGLELDCEKQGELSAELSATLKDNALQLELTARPRDAGELRLRARAPIAADALLAGGPLALGPAQVKAHGEALALASLPTLCKLPSARTSFDLTAKGVGEPAPRADLTLDMTEIQLSGLAGLAVHMNARADRRAASAEGTLRLVDGPQGSFHARVPLRYETSPVPELPADAPVAADVRLPDFPLVALTSFTDAVGSVKGKVDVGLTVRGSLQQPEPRGALQLKHVDFSIASLAQPFSDVSGLIEIFPHKVIVKQLKAHDRDGEIGLVGYATYSAERGGEADLHLSAQRFPIRQQGSIVGELSTRAELTGTLDRDELLRLSLRIKEGRVWLTGNGGRDVQNLDEHPDIRYASEERASPQRDAAEQETSIALASLKIESQRDLWLMHDDFSVQVGVEIDLTTDADKVTLQGQATITRGDLNLLGKPFRIEKGAIRFTGSVPPDPELDLKAKHTTRQGKTLIVQIQGRSSAPEITFSGAANNAGEAAMLLSGMGSAEADSKAKSDAASFAAGLTAGLLAVSARRRFGDWVPMLAIENNAQGAPSGARAGFDASRLIPEFMRGFARGMYVEGVVGSRTNSTSSGVGVGVRVELALPRDFMTSMGYGPGTVWSTDVYWSP